MFFRTQPNGIHLAHTTPRRGQLQSMTREVHYTTTPRLAMDGLTLKAATAIDNLTLKSYSDTSADAVSPVAKNL